MPTQGPHRDLFTRYGTAIHYEQLYLAATLARLAYHTDAQTTLDFAADYLGFPDLTRHKAADPHEEAFLFAQDADGILIVFAGTINLQQLVTMAMFSRGDPTGVAGEVRHAGMTRLLARVSPALNSLLEDLDKGTPVTLIGHSAGGAFAQIFARMLKADGWTDIRNVFTFAAPAFGSVTFNNALEANRQVVVRNNFDLVPFIPPFQVDFNLMGGAFNLPGFTYTNSPVSPQLVIYNPEDLANSAEAVAAQALLNRTEPGPLFSTRGAPFTRTTLIAERMTWNASLAEEMQALLQVARGTAPASGFPARRMQQLEDVYNRLTILHKPGVYCDNLRQLCIDRLGEAVDQAITNMNTAMTATGGDGWADIVNPDLDVTATLMLGLGSTGGGGDWDAGVEQRVTRFSSHFIPQIGGGQEESGIMAGSMPAVEFFRGMRNPPDLTPFFGASLRSELFRRGAQPMHTFRGNDRRLLQKTLQTLNAIFNRDIQAESPGTTQALSTRTLILDGEYGELSLQATDLWAALQERLAQKTIAR